MKKKLCILLAVVLAAGLFAGCGDKKPASGEKVDLLIGLPGDDSVTDMRVVDSFIEARKDVYNVKLDRSGWGDFNTKVKLQLTSKNDVVPVFFTDSAQVAAFGAQNVLVNLDPLVKKDIDEGKYSKALRACTDQNGNLWGIPHSLNTIGILYNKDIFAERGVALPTEDWTWDDMMKMAEELTFDRDGDGKIDVYGLHYIYNITCGWLPFIYAYGANPLSEDMRNANMTDPRIGEALLAYQEGHDTIAPPPAEIEAAGSQEQAFADGKMAMMLCQYGSVKQINKFNPDLNYDAMIMPYGHDGDRPCIYVPNSWVIYNKSAQEVQDASWDWIKYWLDEENQLLQSETLISGFPIAKKAFDNITANTDKPANKDNFYKGIDQWGKTILENPISSELNSIMMKPLAYLKDGMTMEQALAKTNADMQEALDYYYENVE